MLTEMIRGWDRAMWYRAVRWTVKWLIVIAMVIYVLVDLHAKERAAEARLQRIEAAVDSVGFRSERQYAAVGILYGVASAEVQKYIATELDSVRTAQTTRGQLRDSTHRTPDTLLSLGPITVVRRP